MSLVALERRAKCSRSGCIRRAGASGLCPECRLESILERHVEPMFDVDQLVEVDVLALRRMGARKAIAWALRDRALSVLELVNALGSAFSESRIRDAVAALAAEGALEVAAEQGTSRRGLPLDRYELRAVTVR